MCNSITIKNETLSHACDVETLTETIFGPGRFIRAAFKLREGTEPDLNLSFVAEDEGNIIGTVRQTPIKIANHQALLLGPLGICPNHRNLGIGNTLLQQAIKAAQALPQNSYELILLVGDASYYQPYGFKTAPYKNIIFPWPVDYNRVLAFELKEGALKRVSGIAHS
jgi:predicted N-acetyltransferase YhbS